LGSGEKDENASSSRSEPWRAKSGGATRSQSFSAHHLHHQGGFHGFADSGKRFFISRSFATFAVRWGSSALGAGIAGVS